MSLHWENEEKRKCAHVDAMIKR